MHGGSGTALGGVMTVVENQNLIIAEQANGTLWNFSSGMAPVTIPVFICGLTHSVSWSKIQIICYGEITRRSGKSYQT